MYVATIMNHFVLAAMCLFLVIVGMVMYYLNARIKTLETSVSQQNIMLSDVVTSFRKDITEEPIQNMVTNDNVIDDRLYVSDDSEEESDTDTEEDDVIKEDMSTAEIIEIGEPIENGQPVYKKMKVDELRKLIQDSDLAPTDTIPKLKKQELIDILSK